MYFSTAHKSQVSSLITEAALALVTHRNSITLALHGDTNWREDSGPSDIAAASAPEMLIQHSLWRPVRNKEGIKTGYASKTRCKSLKIFRRPRKLFKQTVSSNDSESYMSEEKRKKIY